MSDTQAGGGAGSCPGSPSVAGSGTQARGDRRGDYSPSSPSALPCRVCGARSSGLHFGAMTCEACKVFFRRSLAKNITYTCHFDRNCSLRPGRNQSCSYCRLQKCKDIGMSRQGIKRGRYTIEQKTECLLQMREISSKEQKLMKEKEAKTYPIPQTSCTTQTDHTSLESKLKHLSNVRKVKANEDFDAFIRKVYQSDRKYQVFSPELLASLSMKEEQQEKIDKLQEELFGAMTPIPQKVYDELYKCTGIEVDNRRDLLNSCVSGCEDEMIRYVMFAKGVPGFKDLKQADQIHLIKVNGFAWEIVALLPGFNIEKQIFTCPSCQKTFGKQEVKLLVGEEDVFNLMLSCIGIMKQTNLSFEEAALVKAVLLFSTDEIDGNKLLGFSQIQEKQEFAMRALIYHIQQTHSNYIQRLREIVTVLTSAKDASCASYKSYKKWWEHFPDLDYPELLLELCDVELLYK